jgi:hypothetical protein
MDVSQFVHGGIFLAVLIGVIYSIKSTFDVILCLRLSGPECLRRPLSYSETRKLLFWLFVTAVFVFVVFFTQKPTTPKSEDFSDRGVKEVQRNIKPATKKED